MTAAAAVIDLQEFRDRRRPRRTAASTSTAPRPAPLVPFWVCWVPVWPVR
jgi:hypothetical protein